MISKIIDRYIRWRRRCRCSELNGIDKRGIDQYGSLDRGSTIKSVVEYKCNQCGALWVLADNAQFVSRVDRRELYAKWKSRPWLPTTSQTGVLNRIVGAPDYYGKNIYFPCKLTLPDGACFEKTILVATTGDCFGKYPIGHHVNILQDSHRIAPSEYALPAEVRTATMVAPEKSMGYAPVNVKDTSGKRYTLSAEMHFFDQNGVRGPDITLDESPYHGKNIVHPDWADKYLVCDMFGRETTRRTSGSRE